ncbi:MAG: redoxin domain-containing protein [Ignavibacteria bacterium]|nr:redoxin domain-containing protein [Ignavibacteria bacterium]MBI3765155.1 redoxin domain-containing protein [Ignavibacteriales bacterium]
MKHSPYLVALVCVLFLSVPQFSLANGKDIFSILPKEPKVGETITVTYNSGVEDAKLKDAKEMDVQVLIYREHLYNPVNQPSLLEASMKREGNIWTGTLTLDDARAKYLIFRFRSEGKKDDNDGKCWDALVYDKDGKPVEGAYLMRGTHYSGGGYFIFTQSKAVKDLAKAKEDLEKERELYPENWVASVTLWNLTSHDETNEAVKNLLRTELDQIYEKFKDNEAALVPICADYDRIGDSSKAQQIRDRVMSRNPKGIFAQRVRWSYISRGENSTSQRIEMMQKYFADFPNVDPDERENKLNDLLYAYLEQKNYDKTFEILSKLKKQDGMTYNSIAWSLIEKGENLEKAVEWAKRSVELSRNPDPALRPPYWSAKDWEKNKGYNLGMVLDTYGFGLFQLGNSKEAEETYREAYELTKGGDADINARYVECLVKNGKYDKAIEVGFACVKSGKNNPKLLDHMKNALVKSEGTAQSYDALTSDKKKSFEAMLVETEKSRVEEMKKKLLENRTSKPSVDFMLNDLDSKPVTLSALKGKVIVIDFWATWCGPCKQSFPYLQKVYEKYQTNDKVVFLAVDTWERLKDYASTLENAKKFMKENKYTFPVVIDVLEGKKTVERYEVEGIPTKFIIDKKGNIAFKGVGFSGPDMVEELTQQIELLLAESLGSLGR